MFNDAIMLLASKGNVKRGARLKQRPNDRLGFNEEKELLSIHKNSFFPLCSLGIALFAAIPCYLLITPKSFSMPNPFFRALPFFLFLLRTLLTFCLAFAKLEARQRTGCRYRSSK